jgi:predicted enzyme related to lactoylglutathione lyase
MTVGLRQPGDFCWINMLTPSPKASLDFYTAVLGWSFTEMPGMGYSINVGGTPVGGLFDVVSPRTPDGMPPVIGLMVKVESADRTAERVVALGGRAEPPFDIMDAGRMAVCHDPNGAQFDIWQPKKMTGTVVDTTQPGAPTWFETLTTDPERAGRFYSALFGWSREVKDYKGFDYTSFVLDGTPIGGMMQITPDMGPLRPHWGIYFTVSDADEAARKATRLGGTICVSLKDIPGVGRFCGLTSPQGVSFSVIAYGGG